MGGQESMCQVCTEEYSYRKRKNPPKTNIKTPNQTVSGSAVATTAQPATEVVPTRALLNKCPDMLQQFVNATKAEAKVLQCYNIRKILYKALAERELSNFLLGLNESNKNNLISKRTKLKLSDKMPGLNKITIPFQWPFNSKVKTDSHGSFDSANQLSGKGEMVTRQGAYIFGSFEGGKPHGLCYVSNRGREFIGRMNRSEMVEGVYYEGPTCYKGTIVDGVPQGVGQLIIQGAFNYIGSFAQGNFVLGTIEFNGSGHRFKQYSGQFKDGKPHGLGQAVTQNNSVARGKFHQGRFLSGLAYYGDNQFQLAEYKMIENRQPLTYQGFQNHYKPTSIMDSVEQHFVNEMQKKDARTPQSSVVIKSEAKDPSKSQVTFKDIKKEAIDPKKGSAIDPKKSSIKDTKKSTASIDTKKGSAIDLKKSTASIDTKKSSIKDTKKSTVSIDTKKSTVSLDSNKGTSVDSKKGKDTKKGSVIVKDTKKGTEVKDTKKGSVKDTKKETVVVAPPKSEVSVKSVKIVESQDQQKSSVPVIQQYKPEVNPFFATPMQMKLRSLLKHSIVQKSVFFEDSSNTKRRAFKFIQI